MSSVIEEAKGWYVRPEYPVLFLHGIGNGPEKLEPHAQLFREKGVMAISVQIPPYDNRLFNFGHVANWCKKEIDKIGSGRVGIVGQSLGGLIALKFAASYPDQVAYLVINSSPCGKAHEAKWWLVTMLRMLKPLPPQIIKTGLGALGSIPGVRINELSFLLRNNPRELIHCYLGHTQHDWTEEVRAIPKTVPIVFRRSIKDRPLNMAGYKAIYEANDAVLLEDPNGGHEIPQPDFILAMAAMAMSRL